MILEVGVPLIVGHAQVRGRVREISALRLGVSKGGTLEFGDGLGARPVAACL